MNHLNYGQFDSSNADIAFTEENNYTNPASEIETRKQLSYPLKEIKDFLHDAISIDDSDNVIQLKVEDGQIKYRTTGETWNDISGGIPSGGTTGQVLKKKTNTDYDVEWGSETPDTETIATDDRLVFYDNSGSKLAKSSIQFGANANKYLRNDGTWQNVKCGVDMTNILFTKTIAKSDQTLGEFTSDYDGWLRVTNTDGHNTFSLDGVTIPRDADTQRMYLISKGTVIKRVNYYPVGSENDAGMTIVIYGLK